MLKVLEDVEVMVTTDSEDEQAGAAAGCREMETRRRSHSAINTHHLHINTHLSVAARGLTPPPPRPHPAPDTDYQIFVGRGPSTQEPGARGVRGSDIRRHSFLNDAMRKNARLIFRVLGMLKVYFLSLMIIHSQNPHFT